MSHASASQHHLKPAAYLAMGIGIALVLVVLAFIGNWINQQFIHPGGYAVPAAMAATYTPTPTPLPSPTPNPSPTSELDNPSPAKSPTPSAMATSTPAATDKITETLTVDWELLLLHTLDYAYVKENGRPADKGWWGEMIDQFYTGAERERRLQMVEHWFKPDATEYPSFIKDVGYVVDGVSCVSGAECTFTVTLQTGQLWAYIISTQTWLQAGEIEEPASMVGQMQYDRATKHWKVAQ